MTHTPDFVRPPKELIESLAGIGSATAAGELSRLGVRDPHIHGPVAWTPGKSVVGPALTLQFMPKREDIHGGQEYQNPERQLHRHVLYHTQPGDIVVVDARGDMASGIFGEMMLTYFMGRGGLGVVIDGCIRDFPHAKGLDLGLWLRGVTPNYHTQTNISPHAVNVPIACGNVLVMPGDIIIADDDGAVVVPAALAPELQKKASEHAEWEDFTRMRLAQGGDLRKYYPLSDEARVEYEEWKKTQGK
jgi:regulator of RNase E activity RraA